MFVNLSALTAYSGVHSTRLVVGIGFVYNVFRFSVISWGLFIIFIL